MKKLIKATWQHIRRSPYQSLTAIGMMSLTLFVALAFFLTALGSQAILNYFEGKPQITVFFTDQKKSEDIKALEEKLKATGWVLQTKYISKEEALSIYRKQNKKDPLLLEMVTANILPASLDVSAKDPQYLSGLVKTLQAEPNVEEVVYQKDIVDLLITWTQTIRKTGLVLVGFLTVLSLLILLTIIGMKIAIRKEEIEILRLIGASKWYIRWPFLLEGAFYGGIAALIGWIASACLLIYLMPYLKSFLSGVPLFTVSPIFLLELFLSSILIGVGVGIIGSLLAVWRYLKD